MEERGLGGAKGNDHREGVVAERRKNGEEKEREDEGEKDGAANMWTLSPPKLHVTRY
jgi:hypothetical protein